MKKVFAILITLCILFSLGYADSNPTHPPIPYRDACTVDLEAGDDVILCGPGSTALTPTVIGDIFSIQWDPISAVSSPNSLNTTANVSTTTTLDLTVQTLAGVNQVLNGDFSMGDTGFTTDYEYGTGGNFGTLSSENQYAIDNSPADAHNNYADCGDHTGGGNMMIVNGSGLPNNVWCQNITVEPNSDYAISVWATSAVTQNPAQLQFSINAVLIGGEFDVPAATCTWSQFFSVWSSGGATSAELCIVNVNTDPAGNDFALDDISVREICESTDQLTITVANMDASWTNPGNVCQSDPALNLNTLLTADATTGGVWTIDGDTSAVFNPATLSPGAHTIDYAVALGNCSDSQSQTIIINDSPIPGNALTPPRVCADAGLAVNLADLLEGEDPGGAWAETSTLPSTNGAFNSLAGTFDPTGQATGIYTFTYTLPAPAPCPNPFTEVSVIIDESPVADAGDEITLGCTLTEATIGGTLTSTGTNYTYSWTGQAGNLPDNPTAATPTVDKPDLYTLVVTDENTGCTATDQVEVFFIEDNITATINTLDPDCSDENSGLISIDEVMGGVAPYRFSIDGVNYTTSAIFPSLEAGNYEVIILDDNGCTVTYPVSLVQAEQLSVVFNVDNDFDPPVISRGDSLLIELFFNRLDAEIDSVVWSEDLPNCTGNCTSVYVSPTESVTYTVNVVDINGCSARGSLNVIVERKINVYIPNAFSPNGDGINDLFMINAGSDVARVMNFRVLSRWGDLMYDQTDFLPNDPAFAWDGFHRNELLGNGIYVYMAEIELVGGEVVIFSGEVMLLK